MKKFLLYLLPTSVLCGGLEHNVGWSLLEAHAQGSSPEPIAWVIGQTEDQRLGRSCMASLLQTVSKEQAESGEKYDVRIGLFLNSASLEVRLPVRPSEPLFNRFPSINRQVYQWGNDTVALRGPDDSRIDTFGAVIEELPPGQPPNKLLAILPVKFICDEREEDHMRDGSLYFPGCEAEIPRDDLLIKLSRADSLEVFFLTDDWTKEDPSDWKHISDWKREHSISIPESAKVINSLNNCVAALSNDQSYQDGFELRAAGSAGD